jgi:hypothetical protein
MEFALQTDKDATAVSVLIAEGKRNLIFPWDVSSVVNIWIWYSGF